MMFKNEPGFFLWKNRIVNYRITMQVVANSTETR